MERTKCRFLCGLSGRSYPLERNFVPSREGCQRSHSKAAQKFRAVYGLIAPGDGTIINMYRVYLKSRKFSLFLQTQLDFAWNSLEIHKGFLRLFALEPACACEIFVIFFVFRYTLGPNEIPDKTPIRILYIGHIKYVQWGIFDGNISRNALKKPSKPKN